MKRMLALILLLLLCACGGSKETHDGGVWCGGETGVCTERGNQDWATILLTWPKEGK